MYFAISECTRVLLLEAYRLYLRTAPSVALLVRFASQEEFPFRLGAKIAKVKRENQNFDREYVPRKNLASTNPNNCKDKYENYIKP
jgi:hypothetical protein